MSPGALALRRRAMRLAAVAALVTGAETVWVAWRARDLYRRVSEGTHGWRGNVFAEDPELGYAPVPGARGAQTFPVGPDLPLRHDAEGFRVPVKARPERPRRRPLVLALGGSFTYAAACRAEDAYVCSVAEGLGGSAVNAGVPGWGLASMVLRARRVVPRLRPDVVLVQYSPWLLERAVRPMAPSYAGLTPVPYFAEDGEDGPLLAPPVFRSTAFGVPLSEYARRERTWGGFASFFARVAVPLMVHDDLHTLRLRAGSALGTVPLPSRDGDAVLRRAYGELAELSRAAGARLGVVVLERGPWEARIPDELKRLDVVVVNAHAALLGALQEDDPMAYARAYHHWRGDPPVPVDPHPNPRAHRIIAGAVLEALRSASPDVPGTED